MMITAIQRGSHMFRKTSRVVGSAALLFAGACAGLDVENPNNPDISRALASGDDVKAIAISNLNNWYLSSTYLYPYLAQSTSCDCGAANFGNFGMRFHNVEPRDPYINSSSAGDDRFVAESGWEDHYGVIGSANDVLKALDAGVKIFGGTAAAPIDESDKYRTLALFTQAASLSQLAMQFDSAFVVDEDFDASAGAPVLARYDAVSTAAMAKWDALLTHLNGRSDTYPTDATTLPLTGGVTLSSANIARISRTLAAHTLRLTPRSRTELDAKPASFWQQIYTYTSAGVNADIVVQGDFNQWYSYINYYGNEASWMRVDHRVINRMDSFGTNAPVHFRYRGTQDIMPPQNPTTNDQRLASGATTNDFRYRAGVIGDPARGIFMQSAYSHDRYIGHARTSATAARTPVPYILKADNDLMLAEAEIRRTGGSIANAVALINITRVGRGGLPPVTIANSTAELLAAIDHERDVELFNTNGFNHYWARSAPVDSPLGVNTTGGGRLQPGTPRHWPVPASELEVLNKAVYTYGGIGKPDMIVIGSNGEEIGISRVKRPASLGEMFFARAF
jgi:hypothetical protein